MTYLTNIYKKPQINLVDGVATDESLLNLAFQIETGFDEIGNTLGNIYGNGMGTSTRARYFNSMSTAIGDIGYLSPEQPFGVKFESYTQTFVNTGTIKDFSLDLVPTEAELGSVSIVSTDTIVWNIRQSDSMLEAIGDYSITGRVLSFFVAPTGSFSIIYTGIYPQFMDEDGYMPNVYPSPKLIAKGIIQKPEIILTSEGRYRVTFKESSKNSDEIMFGDNLELHYSEQIQPYVSPIGDIEVPSEYVNAWVFRAGEFVKIEARSIYLLSSTQIEIDTDEEIDSVNDVIVISIANVTISSMLRSLYTSMINHDHGKSSGISSINHSILTGLVPISSMAGVIYSKSRVNGNDHPQYMNREGYTPNDPGAYNNAMIGDLLIGSSDPDSLFNNILADSNRLIFGSTSSGISTRYRSAEKDLHVYSPNNGIYINTRVGEGKLSNALSLNGQHLFTYGITDVDSVTHQNLAISSATNRTLFLDRDDPTKFSDIQTNHMFTRDMTLDGVLHIVDSGTLSLGTVRFTESLGDVIISANTGNKLVFSAKTEMQDLVVDEITVQRANIEEDLEIRGPTSEIIFSDGLTESKIKNSPGAEMQVESEKPLVMRTSLEFDGVSGRDPATGEVNGITFTDRTNTAVGEFSSLYVSSQGGTAATPSQNATYLEMLYPESTNLEKSGTGLFLIRSTKIDQIEKGVKYSWKNNPGGTTRIDDLNEWPRAKLIAGFGDFYALKVGTSTMQDKEGVKFGEFNNIFTTGSKGSCPAGMMVIEALSGVAFVTAGADPSDCSNVSYSSVITGDIQARGSVSVESDISAGGDINAVKNLSGGELLIRDNASVLGSLRVYKDLAVDSSLNVLGKTTLTGDATVSGSLKVANGLSASNFTANGISTFNETARFKSNTSFEAQSQFKDIVSIEDKLTVVGITTLDEVHAKDTSVKSLTAAEKIYANSGLEVISASIFHGPIIANSSLDVSANCIVGGSFYGQTLNAQKDLNVSDRTSLEGPVSTRNSVTFNGAGTSRLTVNIPSQFTERMQINVGADINGKTIVTGTIDVYGELTATVLNAGDGTIEQNLNIKGTTTTALLSVEKDATVGKTLYTKNLLTDGSVSFNGNTDDLLLCGVKSSFTDRATFSSGVTISGKSDATGEFSFSGETSAVNMTIQNAKITGSLDSSGMTLLEELRVKANLRVDGETSLRGGATLVGNTILSGATGESVQVNLPLNMANLATFANGMVINNPSIANGDFLFKAPVILTNAQAKDFIVNESFRSNGIASMQILSVDTQLTVDSEILANKGIISVGDVSMSGGSGESFGVSLPSTFANTVEFGGNTTFHSPVTANSTFNFNAKVDAIDIETSALTVNDSFRSLGISSMHSITVENELGVNGKTTLSKGLKTLGDINFKGDNGATMFVGPQVSFANKAEFAHNVTTYGDNKFNGKSEFVGPITAGVLGAGTVEVSTRLRSEGVASLSMLQVDNDAEIGQKLTVGNGLKTSGTVEMLGVPGSTVLIELPTTISDDLIVARDTTVGQKLTVNGVAEIFGAVESGKLTCPEVKINGLLEATGSGYFGGLLTGGSGQINGTMNITNATKIEGPITAKSSLTVAGDVSIASNLFTTGHSILTGGITTSEGNASTIYDLTAFGPMTITGPLSAAAINATSMEASGAFIGRTTGLFEGALTAFQLQVNGASNVSGNSTFDGTVSVSGGTTLQGITNINNYLNVSQGATFSGGIKSVISATTSEITNLTMSGNTFITGDLVASKVEASSLAASGTITGDSSATILGKLTAGSARFIADLRVDENTLIGGTFTAKGLSIFQEQVSMAKTINVGGTAIFNSGITALGALAESKISNLTMSGDTKITDDLQASRIGATIIDCSGEIKGGAGKFSGAITGDTGVFQSSVDIGGAATIGGNTSINNHLTVSNTTTLSDSLSVAGSATFQGGLTATGSHNSYISNLTMSGDTEITGNTSATSLVLSGPLTAFAGIEAQGNIHTQGDFACRGQIATTNGGISCSGNLDADGFGRFTNGIRAQHPSVMGPITPHGGGLYVDVIAKGAYYG